MTGCFLLVMMILAFFSCNVTATQAYESGIVRASYVFWEAQDNHIGELIFLDGVSGIQRRVPVTGERFTVYQDGIMYFDVIARQVVFVRRDGVIEPHPFVQMPITAKRIDWVIAQDHSMIAWTVTSTNAQDQLTTQTFVADITGENRRSVWSQTDTNNSGLRALPISFSPDKATLYMDNHPDGISDFVIFKQYVAVFGLDIQTGRTELLAGERGSSCICGAGISAGMFLRLRLSIESGHFDATLYNLNADTQDTLNRLNLTSDYDTSGDVLISPDGLSAVYALARVSDLNQSTQHIETMFVLVDTVNRTQRALTTTPITQFVRPLTWTEDNSAVIFTSPQQNGTWKINITTGQLDRIATASYIGMIR
jgi:hypothetical protein